jgi:hypothetical protein
MAYFPANLEDQNLHLGHKTSASGSGSYEYLQIDLDGLLGQIPRFPLSLPHGVRFDRRRLTSQLGRGISRSITLPFGEQHPEGDIQ